MLLLSMLLSKQPVLSMKSHVFLYVIRYISFKYITILHYICKYIMNIIQVIFLPDLDSMSSAFATVGPAMESHPAFPQRVNAEFVQVFINIINKWVYN